MPWSATTSRRTSARQRLPELLGLGVDHRQLLEPRLGRDAVAVPGPVEVAVVHVGQRGPLRAGLERGGDPLADPVGAHEVRPPVRRDRQPAVAELALVDDGHAGAVQPQPGERRRVRLPLLGVDALVPEQRVQQPLGPRDARGEPDQPVRPGRQTRAQRAQARRRRRRHARGAGSLGGQQRGEVRRRLGVPLQQPGAQAVDQEHDVRRRLGQHQRVVGDRQPGPGRTFTPMAAPTAGTTSASDREPYAGSTKPSADAGGEVGVTGSACAPRATPRTPAGSPRRRTPRPSPTRGSRSRRRPARRCSRGRRRTPGPGRRPARGRSG